MIKHLFLISTLLLVQLLVKAQQTAEKFVVETKYLLSLPDGYKDDTTKRWPLVIFLHGSGESGTDLNKVKAHGLPKLVEAGKKFPFIVVSPQSSGFGWQPDILYQMLRDIKKKYLVDDDRIYLTGLSMGGYGTWALAQKHPEEFAAIIPICGGGDTTDLWRLRYMPTWNFHGAKDNVVSIKQSETMVNTLKQYNKNVKFTIYPEATHDSWTQTYNNDSLYTWMLAQSKHRFKTVEVPAKVLNSYAGTYVNKSKDTVQVTSTGTQLKVAASRNNLVLNPASPTVFYWMPNVPIDVEFVKDGFILRVDRRDKYTKIK
ncbi:alpha/beta fold hydrolase [uncultured Chitinophaga sp.]|uniref:carboxylesterase family protein n=1 Tax=uncultured Chitinophaga sp. TaxID=339340 RepID=UPI0025CEF97A|nr:alpha/beta fold hydrolase [uncultured Chitinophaga sp.]